MGYDATTYEYPSNDATTYEHPSDDATTYEHLSDVGICGSTYEPSSSFQKKNLRLYL